MPPAIVLCHGLPFHSGLWRGVAAGLADRGHRGPVLTPDLPGYGAAAPLQGDHSVAAHVRWLEAWARTVDLPAWPQVHLVGHEYGGLVAAALAVEHGIGRLTLCSTALGPAWLAARVAAAPVLHRYFYRRHGGLLYRDHAVAPEHRAAVAAAFPMPGTVAFADQMRATGQHLSVRTLVGLAPRLVRRLDADGSARDLVWGADDLTFPPAAARSLARRLGADEVQWIPGARHAAPWTHPNAFVTAVWPQLR